MQPRQSLFTSLQKSIAALPAAPPSVRPWLMPRPPMAALCSVAKRPPLASPALPTTELCQRAAREPPEMPALVKPAMASMYGAPTTLAPEATAMAAMHFVGSVIFTEVGGQGTHSSSSSVSKPTSQQHPWRPSPSWSHEEACWPHRLHRWELRISCPSLHAAWVSITLSHRARMINMRCFAHMADMRRAPLSAGGSLLRVP
mmetsp:Transcript_44863/g.116207  ORF Transcript_44863/g.116207 Transcript_44863/m.116207 type:complete len:201 (+) Transcript_44863:229-831(+)